jgi:hypothetical protein
MRSRVRTGLLIAIAALYVLSVPWYRETGADVAFVFGLPDWVAVALGCYALVAVLNSVAWLLTEVPEEFPPQAARERGEGE